MALRRSIERWRNTVPMSVVEGSRAQAAYCIADAKHDIAHLEALNADLLEALEELVEMRDKPHGFSDPQWYEPAFNRARAALARARGEG